MSDAIQRDLERWHVDGDSAAATRVLDALATEWLPRIRRFYGGRGDESEDALQSALMDLAVQRGEHPLPRCARSEEVPPRAFRALVLKRYLVSRVRSSIPRDRAERAVAEGMPGRVAKEAARQERARQMRGEDPPLQLVAVSSAEPADDVGESWVRAMDRARVIDAAGKLPPREAVLVLLVLGADVTPFAEALSAELKKKWPEATVAAVLDRMAIAVGADWNDSATLPPEVCQVVHFGSREAASRAGRRALGSIVEALREKMGGGS
jgi:hypothetical protein